MPTEKGSLGLTELSIQFFFSSLYIWSERNPFGNIVCVHHKYLKQSEQNSI